MDQDSFRQLLSKPGTGGSRSQAAPPNAKKAKTKKADAAQPAFKPRTVKKSSYRDRASERRGGQPNDYAQVEALAEDFEKRNADKDREELEEQRRYLGGDSEHTVLVKGLDFALLEQNKARAAPGTDDDDSLENAFLEGSSSIPKKRTREDIVAELKNKRAKGSNTVAGGDVPVVDASLEEAKKAGKFKPIGFKAIAGSEGKGKRTVVKKAKGEKGEPKKKKTKEFGESAEEKTEKNEKTTATATAIAAGKDPEPEPEPVDEDFDIFAGAGEYIGLDLGDDADDDEEGEDEPGMIAEGTSEKEVSGTPLQRRWIEDESKFANPQGDANEKPRSPAAEPRPVSNHAPDEPEEGEEREEEVPIRLAPLASSTVPSIRELLAMDDAEDKREKRKANKEKRKGQLTSAAKVDRDYQRLKAYTDKKNAS